MIHAGSAYSIAQTNGRSISSAARNLELLCVSAKNRLLAAAETGLLYMRLFLELSQLEFAIVADDGADVLAADGFGDVALALERKDQDRDLVLHAQGQRGVIHDGQAALDDLEVADGLDGLSLRVLSGIAGEDVVDVLSQQQGFCALLRIPPIPWLRCSRRSTALSP